jgi:hypothetical protein
MSESILEIEHNPGEEVVLRFRPPKLKGLSPESRKHIRAAEKEFLLALRSLIDTAVEAIDKADKPAKKGRTKIEVQ